MLLTLATTLLWATGSFTFFTYIGVILHQAASAGASGLAGFLVVFGIAGLGGASAAGWLTDRTGPVPALAGGLTLTALSLAGLGVIAAAAAGPRRSLPAWRRSPATASAPGRSPRHSSSACSPAAATTGSCWP